MSEDMYDRGGKIPTFDGKAKNFATWWKKFLAYAKMSKFKDILKETRDRNLPEEKMSEENDEITKEQRIAIGKNELAMASFSVAKMETRDQQHCCCHGKLTKRRSNESR
jgi:hypothetical protein